MHSSSGISITRDLLFGLVGPSSESESESKGELLSINSFQSRIPILKSAGSSIFSSKAISRKSVGCAS